MNALWRAAKTALHRLSDGRRTGSPSIGLALGGGFARGMAHIGVIRVLERNQIPIGWIGGVSAGSIVAAAWSSGASLKEIEEIARAMKFRDVAGLALNRLGLVSTQRMDVFLKRLLKVHRFEEMRVPLAIVATDVRSGEAVVFEGKGEVSSAVRASCSYPGLFQPVRHENRLLVDGAVSMEIPAVAVRRLGAPLVVSVALPQPWVSPEPTSVFAVVNRCFQIMQRRTEDSWRRHTDLVIAPQVAACSWDDFSSCGKLIEAGEAAAEQSLPAIRELMAGQGMVLQPAGA